MYQQAVNKDLESLIDSFLADTFWKSYNIKLLMKGERKIYFALPFRDK